MSTSIPFTQLLLTSDATSVNTFDVTSASGLAIGAQGYLTALNIKSLEVTITNISTNTITVIPTTNNYLWSANYAPSITDYTVANSATFTVPAQTVAGLPNPAVPIRFAVQTEKSILQGAGNENEVQVQVGSPTALTNGTLFSVVNGASEVAAVKMIAGSASFVGFGSGGGTGDVVRPSAYTAAAINAAIATIGSDERTLYLGVGNWIIDAAITVPSNITLRLESGANLVNAGGTIIINGPLDAPAMPFFSDFDLTEVNVVYNQEMKVEWFDSLSLPPTSGAWADGAIFYNTDMEAGGSIGWICITAGNPGVWKPFGLISL